MVIGVTGWRLILLLKSYGILSQVGGWIAE
jgi:hypothetical protein